MVDRYPPNPFADFNASLIGEDDILKFWIEPQILFQRPDYSVEMTGLNPVVLMGGRGTGKTMYLKYLSNEIQIRKYIEENGNGQNFLTSQSYLGIYYRFDGPHLSSFKDRNLDNTQWDTLFKHFFELVIAHKYVTMLLNLQKYRCIDINQTDENTLVKRILEEISNNDVFNIEEKESNLLELNKIIQKLISNVFNYINDLIFDKELKFTSNIIPLKKLSFGIPKLLSELFPQHFKQKQFIILLDEYENLMLYQQKIINTLIKHLESPVNFRIGTRINGFKTYNTLNDEEFLAEDADYRKILFEDILISSDKKYKNLLKSIANKRLESFREYRENGLVDIEKILGSLTPEEESKIIVENKDNKIIEEIMKLLSERKIEKDEIKEISTKLSYPENPLIEMLNLLLLRRNYTHQEIIELFSNYVNEKKESEEYKKYKTLYEKYKVGLLFQLISLYPPTKKVYSSFELFSMLSSGIIRNFLELCYQSFNLSLFSGEIFEKGEISINYQTQGASIRSEKFFEMIERIPKHGNEIKSLVMALGAIFYSWQKDLRLSEPEVTFFSVDKTALSEKAREILDYAVQWSVLQTKPPMKDKSPLNQRNEVYALNHILAPKYGISWRIRGRLKNFEAEDLEKIMFSKEEEKKKIIKKLSRDTEEKHSQEIKSTKTLLDYIDG